MNREAMNTWIKALRSGEYGQARGRLARVNNDGSTEYCCLGVACMVYNEAHPGAPLKITPTGYDGGLNFDNEEGVLPPKVAKWLGVEEPYATVEGADGRPTDGPSMNDSEKMSFSEIADVYEAALAEQS